MASAARRTFFWKSPLRGGIDLTFACTPPQYDELIVGLLRMERQHYAYLDALDEGQARVSDTLRLHQHWTLLYRHIFRLLHSYGVAKHVASRWLQEKCKLYQYRWMCDRQPWRVIPTHPCFDAADSARPLLREDEG